MVFCSFVGIAAIAMLSSWLERDGMRKDPSVAYVRLSVPHLKPSECVRQGLNYPGVNYGDGMIWRVLDQHPDDLDVTVFVSSDDTVTVFGCNTSASGGSIAPRDLEVRIRVGHHSAALSKARGER